jgi:Zn-dependent protease
MSLLLLLTTFASMVHASGWTEATCLLAILALHELGHLVQCIRHRVAFSWPIFLPMPFGPIGTLGAVMRVGPMTPRQEVEIAISGPVAGLLVAVPMACCGLQAGWYGLLFTAFNLLPFWRLDGGRIVSAVRQLHDSPDVENQFVNVLDHGVG